VSAVGPLATVADVALRHPAGELTAAQEARAAVLLEDASGQMRDHLEQIVSFVEDDTVTVRTQGARIDLWELPVGAVSSVAGSDGTELPAAAWSWDGLHTVTILDPAYLAPTMQVTYTHGHEDTPAGVVARVCLMVNRVLTAPSATEGLASEQIGQYSYQAAGGSAGVSTFLTKNDEKAVRRYRRGATGTIMVRAG